MSQLKLRPPFDPFEYDKGLHWVRQQLKMKPPLLFTFPQ